MPQPEQLLFPFNRRSSTDMPYLACQDVAKRAFPSLLTVLVQDAPQDVECAKACLETLIVLCESDLIEEEGQHKVCGLISLHGYP
jgi:hypothetical protein